MLTFLVLVAIISPSVWGENNVNYRLDYDPWKSLYREGEKLLDYVEIEGLTEPEQDRLPGDSASLAFKIVLDGVSYTDGLNISQLEANVTESIENKVNTLASPGDNKTIINKIEIIEISNYRTSGNPLIFGYLTLNNEDLYLPLENQLYDEMEDPQFYNMMVHRGRFTATKRVEKNSVLCLVIQLLNEPWPYSMNSPNSKYRVNITDVMWHLINPRYRAIFGEHYYRTVVADFGRTPDSLVVVAYIMVDPDPENLYYGTKIWYSPAGFVSFGRWTLFPTNFYTNRANSVPLRLYKYLSDRSAMKPQAPEFQTSSPVYLITVPVFVVLLILLIGFVGAINCLSAFASERPIILSVAEPRKSLYAVLE